MPLPMNGTKRFGERPLMSSISSVQRPARARASKYASGERAERGSASSGTAPRIVPGVPGSVERPFSTNSTRRPERANEEPSIPPPMPVPMTITSHSTRSASRALTAPSANYFSPSGRIGIVSSVHRA